MNANDPPPTEPRAPVSPPGPPAPDLDDPRVVAALEEYLQVIEAGDKPNRPAFLARHAEVAEALAKCLDGMEALHVAASSAHPAASPPALAPEERAERIRPSSSQGRGSSDGAGEAAAASSTGAWQPGTLLHDFRIIREIGRGGMGIVYEAEDLSLGRRIALKVLPFALTLDPRQLQRFKNEARAAAQLHHSNIVPVHYVGCERGVHFYAMQFIEGQTLAEVIEALRQVRGEMRSAERDARSPGSAALRAPRSALHDAEGVAGSTSGPAEALATAYSTDSPGFFRAAAKLGVQAAEALEHAHAYGVVHRDIKPGNLLMDVGGHLWVADFGLAQFQSEGALTRTGDLLGTLRYMSPEQALAKRGLVDHRTDIYSLGVTLYELLTLEPPYDGRDREELLSQIAFEEPRAPRRWNAHIPADLETIVLKAMAKGVDERYTTAQELAEDLRRFLEHKPILARRPTLLERTAKWARRHKAVVATAACVLLLLAVGLAVCTALVVGEQWKTQAEQGRTKAALEREQRRAKEADEQRARADEQRARAEKKFQQAREVLDVLTEVGEVELADNPFLKDLRRRVLEVVLVYYQNFIDERQGDPSSQPELTAAKERVASILGELYASEDFGRVMFLTLLLRERAVQEALRLSPEQAKQVQGLAGAPFRPFAPSFQTFWQLRPQERRRRFEEMTQAAEKTLATILTPEQATRLKQIALQQRGVQGWNDAEVAQALELTAAQKQNVRTIQAEARKKMPWPPGLGGPSAAKWAKWQRATNDRLLSVLTPKQKTHWDEMIGEPFHGKIGPGFKGLFGPGHGFRPHPGGPELPVQPPPSEPPGP
jgi:serine/threonine protein kinase